jgi:type II secretory pathway component GspD/PulD (secretin)
VALILLVLVATARAEKGEDAGTETTPAQTSGEPVPPVPPGQPVPSGPVSIPVATTPAEPAPASASSQAATPDSGTETQSPTADQAAVGPDGQRLVTAQHVEGPIDRVLSDLSRKSGKNIVARGKTPGQRVTLLARNEPLERALDKLVNSKPNWLWYKPEGSPDTYEIWDQESFRAEVLPRQVRQKVFVPREITAEEAFKAIQGVLTPNIGAASFDPRSNKVIVTDLPYVLELIQRLLDQIDVKFITRVFYIQHADINAMAEKLSNLKSPAAPAPEVDERTRQIIVRDRLEIIRQMELLVETLDIGPEMKVYDLNNLGWEGANIQDIEDAISEIITEGAYFKINAQSGKMIVQDVPEVHEKIEKILAAFDQPAKQVMLEIEIIETRFDEGFNYQVDWAFGDDLFSAAADGLTGSVIPRSTRPGANLSQNLGFLDFRREFPVITGGSGGINTQNLTENAFFALKTAMSDSRTRVLQQPRAIVKNQGEVIFSVGERIPYFTGGGTSRDINNNIINNASTVSFVQAGLDITIRPTINNNGLIEMEVEIQNNRADIVSRVFQNQENEVPQVKNQEVLTTLIVPSGETRVIGGLVDESRSESRSGIPGLIKIPVLGPALFGKYDKPQTGNARRNLLVFITPTIVIENPGDMLAYKGRLITGPNQDSAADGQAQYPPIEPTRSDTQLEPIPVEFPPAPGVPVGPDDMAAALEPPSSPVGSQQETFAMEDREDDGEILPLDEFPTADSDGLTDLRRVRIADQRDTGPLGVLPPRIPGPTGALTGPTGGTRAGTAQPAGPGPGGPASVPQPAVAQPPAGQAPAPPRAERPTPPPQPPPTPAPPPPAETIIR